MFCFIPFLDVSLTFLISSSKVGSRGGGSFPVPKPRSGFRLENLVISGLELIKSEISRFWILENRCSIAGKMRLTSVERELRSSPSGIIINSKAGVRGMETLDSPRNFRTIFDYPLFGVFLPESTVRSPRFLDLINQSECTLEKYSLFSFPRQEGKWKIKENKRGRKKEEEKGRGGYAQGRKERGKFFSKEKPWN